MHVGKDKKDQNLIYKYYPSKITMITSEKREKKTLPVNLKRVAAVKKFQPETKLIMLSCLYWSKYPNR